MIRWSPLLVCAGCMAHSVGFSDPVTVDEGGARWSVAVREDRFEVVRVSRAGLRAAQDGSAGLIAVERVTGCTPVQVGGDAVIQKGRLDC